MLNTFQKEEQKEISERGWWWSKVKSSSYSDTSMVSAAFYHYILGNMGVIH